MGRAKMYGGCGARTAAFGPRLDAAQRGIGAGLGGGLAGRQGLSEAVLRDTNHLTCMAAVLPYVNQTQKLHLELNRQSKIMT